MSSVKERLVEELKQNFKWIYLEEKGWVLLADFILERDRKNAAPLLEWVEAIKKDPQQLEYTAKYPEIAIAKTLKNLGVGE